MMSAAAVGPAAAVAPAADAGASARRKASCLSAMIVAAEGARSDAALALGLSVPSSRLVVSIERIGRCAGPGISTARAFGISTEIPVHSARHIAFHAPLASTPIVIASVVKRVAPGKVPVLVINRV